MGITESKNITCWKGPARIIASNSIFYAELLKKSNHMCVGIIQMLLEHKEVIYTANDREIPSLRKIRCLGLIVLLLVIFCIFTLNSVGNCVQTVGMKAAQSPLHNG